MSKPKHTKGPWYILPTPEVNLIRTEGEKGHTYIAKVIKDPDKDNKGLNTNEGRGNAHLIAAAPEMYEALEQAVGALKQYWEYGEAMKEYGRGFQANYKGYSDYDLKVMEHILKKARGES